MARERRGQYPEAVTHRLITNPGRVAVTDDPEGVATLSAELNRLTALLHTGIAAALNVTLNFDATDGD